MIAQARITSDTRADVYLETEIVELEGKDLPEVRSLVKRVFIEAAREAGGPVDVVIVEPDVRHHLTVEPSGRITGRPADDRPLFGPEEGAPLVPVDPSEHPHAATTSWAPDAAGAAGSALAPAGPARGGSRRKRAATHSASSASAPSSLSAGSSLSAPSAAGHASAASPSSAAPDPGVVDAVGALSSATPSSPTRPGAPAPGPLEAAGPLSAGPLDPAGAPSGQGDGPRRPTLADLQASTSRPKRIPATKGLPGFLHRLTRGVISPRPNRVEQHERDRAERLRRPVDGPKNIAVVNLKGGAHKTTASLMIAATLGVARGGGVLAWDNNETRGTLGWRGVPPTHHRTALDLLHDLDLLRSPRASVAELDRYVRSQGETRFDILASDEDPGSAALIDGVAFDALNETLSRFYRMKVIDTGNNVRASNWLAAVRSADQLVIVSTVREDTFNAAAWMIDELRATGLADQVDHAVTILSHSSRGKFDPVLRKRLVAHFGAHTRAIAEVPYEESFVDGSPLNWPRVSEETKEAWMEATALIVDGL